jgi:hypothetical protein
MLPKLHPDDPQTYAQIDSDGKIRITCTDEYLEFQEWMAQGNTPEPVEQD